ncbi:hypothetical protein ACQKFM_04815 [Paenibacillus xylanexedens]
MAEWHHAVGGSAPRLWGRGAFWRASHSLATVDAPSVVITEV